MQTICDLFALKVIYQDDYLVAVHKPAGLLVHRSALDKYETQFAVQLTRDLIGQKVYPLHRLDKPTSGCLLFALDPVTARHMGAQFKAHQITKTYLAICRGWTPATQCVEHPLKYKVDKIAEKNKTSAQPQIAQTYLSTLKTTLVDKAMGRYAQQRYSLVALTPTTGRKHQLRRHLAHINYPIIGDVAHGDRHHNHFFQERFAQQRLYLAATQLSFTHPVTKAPVTLQCPLEDSFKNIATQLELIEHSTPTLSQTML